MTFATGRITVLEAAVFLLPSAGYFAYTAKLPHVPILTGVFLLISFFFWKPLKISDRLVIYLAVAALAATIFADSAYPLAEGRFTFLIALLHPEILVPFLLYQAAMLTISRNRPLILGASAFAAITSIAFCGEQEQYWNTASQNPPTEILSQQMIYFCSMFLTLLLLLWYLRKTYRIGSKWPKEIIAMLTCLFVVAGAFALTCQTHSIRKAFRNFEMLFYGNSLNQATRRYSALNFFESSSLDINSFLTPEMFQNESDIVFQVIGTQPPGYLRGMGYSQYHFGGKWSHGSKELIQELPAHNGTGLEKDRSFIFPRPQPLHPVRWTILPTGIRLHNTAFYPAGATEIRMLAEKAHLTASGTLSISGGTLNAGYTVFAADNRDCGAPTTFQEQEKKMYLQYPGELFQLLREIRYITQTLHPLPDDECFRKLLIFFRDNFCYSLTPERPDKDPVEHFLRHTRRGHCELYASSMVLLLRSCGIPARYVTGFICDEPHRSGRSYIARTGNAHAWVEAYDRDRQQWVLLDPTPPTPPIPPRDHEEIYQWKESILLGVQEFLSELRRGHVAEAISGLLRGMADTVFRILKHYIFWLFIGILFITAGVFLQKKWVQKKWSAALPGKRKLIRQYWYFLLKMYFCRKIPLFSRPTALEMEKILRHAPLPPEKQQKALEFLQTYRKERFKP